MFNPATARPIFSHRIWRYPLVIAVFVALVLGVTHADVAQAKGVGFSQLQNNAVAAPVSARAQAPAAQASASCALQWRSSPHPTLGNPGFGLNGGFQAIAASGASDVWAAGAQVDHNSDDPIEMAAIMHWNGLAWTFSALPALPGGSAVVSRIDGLTAVAANDVWAVGHTNEYEDANGLILRWNGAQWSVVASPTIAGSKLSNIVAISANNIYATGNVQTNAVARSLLEHWDGATWSEVTMPDTGMSFTSISASGANDIWISGLARDSFQSRLLHWNGATWSAVTRPTAAQAPPTQRQPRS